MKKRVSKDKKTERIVIRCSSEVKDILTKAAHQEARSLPNYLVWAGLRMSDLILKGGQLTPIFTMSDHGPEGNK